MKNLLLARLQSLVNKQQLPHAWLLNGTDLNTSQQIAKQFSQWLLCSTPLNEQACGTCKSCHLFSAATHPDFYALTPIAGSEAILIDEVRNLNNFVVSKAQMAQHKIILIWPAEKLNRQAANALLKSLEDPGPQTIFILLSTHVNLLLPTIVSRCLQVNLVPGVTTGVDTVHVQQMLQDLADLWLTKRATPIQTVEKWLKQWPDQVLYWFELVLTDLLLFQYGKDAELLKFAENNSIIANLCAELQSNKLWQMLERIKAAQMLLATKHRPNMQLLLEDIIL